MRIGYARISTTDQNLQLQLDALDKAGVDRVFTDAASGANRDRPGLDAALKMLDKGDELVIYKLDRLGRSVVDLANIVADLGERGVELRSVTDGFDTTTNGGKLVFHIMGAVAEFERNLIRERVSAGIASARKAGRHPGPQFRMDDADLDELLELWPTTSVPKLAKRFKVSRDTIYRSYKRALARNTRPANGKR